MDNTRFDRLTRELLSVDSRRNAVRTLAAASLSLGLVRLGSSRAVAKNKKKRNKKKKNKNKNQNVDTKNLREPCTSSVECKGNLLCDIAYSQQSCPGQETGTFCCVQTDVQAKCNDSCDCCGLDVICNGGYCQSA
jgi:hypothetical protein